MTTGWASLSWRFDDDVSGKQEAYTRPRVGTCVCCSQPHARNASSSSAQHLRASESELARIRSGGCCCWTRDSDTATASMTLQALHTAHSSGVPCFSAQPERNLHAT